MLTVEALFCYRMSHGTDGADAVSISNPSARRASNVAAFAYGNRQEVNDGYRRHEGYRFGQSSGR